MTSEVVFDIEANGLTPSKIFCAVTYDMQTGERREFDPSTIHELPAHLNSYDKIVGHNIIAYDVYHLNRLMGASIPYDKLEDTLVLSQMYHPQIKKVMDSRHSLEAWGYRQGKPKVQQGQWDYYEPSMLVRCNGDVDINVQLWKDLKVWMQNFNRFAIEIEYKVKRLVCEQERNGFPFDIRGAIELKAEIEEELEAASRKVQETMGPLPDFVRLVEPKYRQDGELSKVGLKHLGDKWEECVGPHSRIVYTPFNVGSRKQIGRHLQLAGWVPEKFTDTGQPVVDEETLEGIDIPECKIIHRYLMLQKRNGFLAQCISEYNEDTGCIHGNVITVGAITHRMAHFGPNIAQTVAKDKEYGPEIRALFTYKPPYLLLGTDASGLELRAFAHYLDDPEYTKELIEGDVHRVHLEVIGFPFTEENRNITKTFIYAYLYGAGIRKLASILGFTMAATKKVVEKFNIRFPKLKAIKEEIAKQAKKKTKDGDIIVRSYDGRPLRVRGEHSVLNTLLQNLGAVICKVWLIRIMKHVEEQQLDVKLVASIHDEYQFLVHYKDAKKLRSICKLAIKEAEDILRIKCPLDCGVSVAKNWSMTH